MADKGETGRGISVKDQVASRTDIKYALPEQVLAEGQEIIERNKDDIRFQEIYQRLYIQNTMLLIALKNGEITNEEFIKAISSTGAQGETDSYVDTLTGYLSRNAGLRMGLGHIMETPNTGEPVSIMMIDLDNFKKVNDKYGHNVGDIALKSAASHIDERLRISDERIRYGGDEFLIILPATEIERALKVAQRVRQDADKIIKSAMRSKGYNLDNPVTLSIGLSQLLPLSRRKLRSIKPFDLLKSGVEAADIAEVQAKRHGGNKIVGNRVVGKKPEFFDESGEDLEPIESKEPKFQGPVKL